MNMRFEKIRKQKSERIYNHRASHISVEAKAHTTHLPRGTLARFAGVALNCAAHDAPLNTMLTLRWHALRAEGAAYPYLSLPPRDRIAKSVELIRHFFTHRGLKFIWIWVQENRSDNKGLHWHIAFHCPQNLRRALLGYVEHHFGLSRLPQHMVPTPTKGELGRSEANAWHLAYDTNNALSGLALALYLGKGEGTYVDRAALRDAIHSSSENAVQKAKLERISDAMIAKHFGSNQGWIEGTNKDRFAISRAKFT